jgi:hypothetical protein
MKNTLYHLLSLTALISFSTALADVVPYIAIRSQGFNAARELVGWQDLINRYDMDCVYGAFSITPEYTRTFKSYRLAEALFGDVLDSKACNTHCSTFLVQGTKVSSRNPRALMAENFYLPADYSSEVTIYPRVDNFLVDFNFYLGLDEWCNGLYFRIHTPICHTKWHMNFCENIVAPGTLNYDPGYFNDAIEGTYPNEYGINRGKMLNSFEEYIVDNRAINGVPDTIFNSLNRARIAKCPLTKTRLAEVTAALGWNFINRENGTLGFNVRAAAPTGSRPEACYLFEAMVGNGHHWELGCGLNSRWCMWRATDEGDDLTFYFDANVTHLFKTHQCRTFDLTCKPLSRYMLAMKFTNNVANLLAGGNYTTPDYQFTGEYMPVANLTTMPVEVSAAVQADLALKFAYTHTNFQFDVGYGFWARSCLKINYGSCCQNNFSENTWALKGDAFTYGFTTSSNMYLVEDSAVALSATENAATILGGTNQWASNGTDTYAWNQNPGIDNPQLAYNDDEVSLNTKISGGARPTVVNTSLQPIFIKGSDFNINGARTKGLSNKVFTNFGYIWKDRQDWQPFLGLGAEVEWAQHNEFCCTAPGASCTSTNNSCNKGCQGNNKPCCKTIALTQWGVWVKGGVAFD